MTIKSMTLILFLLAAVMINATASGQDLFKKKGGLSDAFSKGKSDTKTGNNRSTFTFSKMEKFVLGQNFKDTKKITERAYRFTFKHKDWTLPTIIEVSRSNTNLWVTMVLDHLKGNPNDYPDRLWKLLEFNGNYGDCFFSVVGSSKAITLVGAIQLNGDVTDKDIMEHLEYLGGISIKTEDLWNTDKWKDAPKYVGSWSTTGEPKMSIVLGRSGQFTLTSPSGTKTVGSYKIVGGKIEMTEKDGETIEGKIDFADANNFTLEVNGNKMKFRRR